MQIPGMKTAFVSQVYSYMSDSPTILQLLVYWLASSSNGTIEGTFDIPQVGKLLTLLFAKLRFLDVDYAHSDHCRCRNQHCLRSQRIATWILFMNQLDLADRLYG